MIPTFFGIILICFSLTRLLPGGPLEQYLASRKGGGNMESGGSGSGKQGAVSEEEMKKLQEKFDLDKPFLVAFWKWAYHKNLGLTAESTSFSEKKVLTLIAEKIPVSLIFGITGFFLTYLICIPLGITKALRDGSFFDLSTTTLVFIGYSLPPLAFALLLKLMFCGVSDHFFNWLPAAGYYSDNYDNLNFWGRIIDVAKHMLLPVICYIAGNFAVITILMKNSLMEQISQDYIRTVIARGGKFRLAIWGHALRNALIPIATGIGGIMTIMFAGSIIIERIFEIRGMGFLSIEAIVGRDYPVFLGILVLTTILSMLGNLLSDFCYMIIDPRINFDK